jgi:hypothetical protein
MMTRLAPLAEGQLARAIVLGVYLAGFTAAALLVAITPHLQENFKNKPYLDLVLELYSVPLTVVIAGVASTARRDLERLDLAQCVLLYGSTFIWNALILLALIVFDFGLVASPDRQWIAIDPSALQGLLQLIKEKLSYLITAILVLVYGASSSTKKFGAAS